MKLKKRTLKICSTIIFITLILQTVSCGTILYPERRSSPSTNGFDPAGRKIDLAVAFLDAVCLVFYVVPGLVAFAVDFATGAIYLPKNKKASTVEKRKDSLVIHVPPGEMNQETIKKIVFQETGVTINFEDNNLKTFKMEGQEAAGFLMAGFNDQQLPAK